MAVTTGANMPGHEISPAAPFRKVTQTNQKAHNTVNTLRRSIRNAYSTCMRGMLPRQRFSKPKGLPCFHMDGLLWDTVANGEEGRRGGTAREEGGGKLPSSPSKATLLCSCGRPGMGREPEGCRQTRARLITWASQGHLAGKHLIFAAWQNFHSKSTMQTCRQCGRGHCLGSPSKDRNSKIPNKWHENAIGMHASISFGYLGRLPGGPWMLADPHRPAHQRQCWALLGTEYALRSISARLVCVH